MIVTKLGAQERPTKTITAKMITTSRVPKIRTLRPTPGVEPARASVAVSRTGGSESRASLIYALVTNYCSRGQRAARNRVPELSCGYGGRVEKQRLRDRRFHGRALERLSDEECRLRPGARQQPLG